MAITWYFSSGVSPSAMKIGVMLASNRYEVRKKSCLERKGDGYKMYTHVLRKDIRLLEIHFWLNLIIRDIHALTNPSCQIHTHHLPIEIGQGFPVSVGLQDTPKVPYSHGKEIRRRPVDSRSCLFQTGLETHTHIDIICTP